jgi:hypothetical protein
MQRSTLQISEEDHLQIGDIIYNINGEYYKNRFDIISKLSSLSGIAEINVLRKSNGISCCFGGSTLDEIPYCNSIFAQNSIKLAMRKYEKPGIKSSSDADIAFTISERASAEPQIIINDTVDNQHACTTTTTIVKYEHDSMNDSSNIELTVSNGDHDIVDTYEESLLVRPKIGEVEAKKKVVAKHTRNLSETKIQIKVTATFQSDVAISSSFRDDNWIFYGKKQSDDDDSCDKFQTTSSILLNNDFSNNDTDCNNKNITHTSAIDIMPSTTVTHLDGNYYFTEDTTLRTLTNSSCHSDRSLVQLNLVCCEIDHKNEDNEKGSSRISEEEEEGEEEEEVEENEENNEAMMNLEPHSKCNLNQDSLALKSYSHLPSSTSCSSDEHILAKSFINSCKIDLNKEYSLVVDEQIEENLVEVSLKQEFDDIVKEEEKKDADNILIIQEIIKDEDIIRETELSNILQNMISEIEENSKNVDNLPVVVEDVGVKDVALVLLEALNNKTIGTVIYENCVDEYKVDEVESKIELKIETPEAEVEAEKHLFSRSSMLNYKNNLLFYLSFFF